MTQALYLALAATIGVGSALQIALVGAMSRQRGPTEASWASILGTIAGFALILALRVGRGERIELPSPFGRGITFVVAAVIAGGALALAMRGLAPGYAVTGLLAIPFLVGAGFLAPRLGIGLYLAAIVAGQLIGAVALDHVGAFGAQVHRIDATRAAGIAALVLGVVLVKGVGR